MIGLVETGWMGAAFALSDIVGFGPVVKDKDGNRDQTIRLRNGEVIRVTDNETGQIMRRPAQVLPAAPSTDMLHWWDEKGEIKIGFTPVIAWALCVDGELRAMTTAGVNDGLSEPPEGNYVRLPDGRIHNVGGYGDCAYFDNADAFQTYLTGTKLMRQEQESAAAAYAAKRATSAEKVAA